MIMMRQRLTVSVLLAVLLHAAILLLVQLFLLLAPERMPPYSGPLVVTIEPSAVTPVLPRTQERPPQPEPQPVPQERPPQPSVARQPAPPPASRTQPAPATRTAPRPSAAPPPAEPAPEPRGTRQVVPAEPLGTLPPLAPDESTPYVPQTYTEPLPDQGPIAAAPSQEARRPLLDTSRLDSAIAQPGAAPGTTPTTAPPTSRPGTVPGTAASGIEGFQIDWRDPREGREVVQSEQPVIPSWVSQQGLTLQVVVSFALKPSGILDDIRRVRSSGYPDVDSAVISALRRWRFSASPGAPDVRGEVTYRIIAR